MMNYNFHDKVVLRTPLKPMKQSFTQEELVAFFKGKEGREALFLASPDLCAEFDRWLEGKVTDKNKEERLMLSLLKYANRIHHRCTPFGLFASCGVLEWGEEDEQVQLDAEQLYRSTRLDMHFSCQLAQKLAQIKWVKPYLLFYPNSSLYGVKDKYRYVEYSYQNKRRVYQISAVDHSIYVEKILDKARQGATINELIQVLPEMDAEISHEDSAMFVEQLISEQLLVSEIEPSVSGDELLDQILVVLNRLEPEDEDDKKEVLGAITFLNAIKDALGEIDAGVFNEIEAYQNLAARLEGLEIPFELSKLFQTDLFREITVGNKLPKTLKPQLRKVMRVLNKLITPSDEGALKNFREKFYERYEDAEVPLLTVLDNEAGIGYAGNTNHTGDYSPLVNELMIPGVAGSGKREMKWGRIDGFLHRKLVEAIGNGKKTVELSEKDFDQFEDNWDDLPDSLSVMFSHNGEQLIVSSMGGASGINLLGRFASGNPEINELIADISSIETQLNPDKILAEVVHLPEARTGNILMRPSFRGFEIPYLSRSNVSVENQLDLEDLYVSIVDQKFVLRSKKRNKEILPRLGNAHNFSAMSLPVYHFLCDLQTESIRAGFSFHWGALHNEFNFLPRVELDGIIISPASWTFTKKDVDELIKDENVDNWRLANDLPERVLFSEGDNELLINFTDELGQKLFLSLIKKKGVFTLKEFLFKPEKGMIENSSGQTFTNQLVATIFKTQAQSKAQGRFREAFNPVERNFSAGSEWLYYKLYGGTNSADELVAEVIKPMTEKWLEEGVIDRWFYIRYSDPDTHLRVRFHFADLSKIGIVLMEFNQALRSYLDSGQLWKVQLDTYKRELERYGNDAIELAEQIFFYDSQNISTLLSLIDYGGEGEKIRWLYALRAVNCLLDDFGLPLEDKKGIMEGLRNGFGSEFGMNKFLNKQIDKQFRADKKEIESILKENETDELQPLYDLLELKSKQIKPMVEELILKNNNGELPVNLQDLVCSLIHMLLNRLFKNKQRLHELVIYDFLWKKYRSDWARAKYTAN